MRPTATTPFERRSINRAVKDGGDLAHIVGEGEELFGKNGLHAVGESFIGFVVDFDEQAVGADGHRCARERQNFVAFAGAVAGVNENRKVAALFDGRDDGEVERIAGKIGESADATFAEHDVVIAFGEDVFGGHEEFVKRGGHTALEEDGFFGAAGALEKRKVLHVARADLNDVGILFDKIERFVVNRFGDDAEAVRGADFGEDFEAVLAESLKAIRGSPWFVSAAAEESRAGFFDAFCNGHALRFGFDGARASDKSDVFAADEDVTRWSRDAADRVFFLGVAADEFVGLADGNAFADAGHGFEDAEVNGAFVAGDTDGGADGTWDGVGLQTEAFNPLADGADLLLGSVGLHDDQHECSFGVRVNKQSTARGRRAANSLQMACRESEKLEGLRRKVSVTACDRMLSLRRRELFDKHV